MKKVLFRELWIGNFLRNTFDYMSRYLFSLPLSRRYLARKFGTSLFHRFENESRVSGASLFVRSDKNRQIFFPRQAKIASFYSRTMLETVRQDCQQYLNSSRDSRSRERNVPRDLKQITCIQLFEVTDENPGYRARVLDTGHLTIAENVFPRTLSQSKQIAG